MANTLSTTPTLDAPTPYRTNARSKARCVAQVGHAECDQLAHARCRRCGRTFCLDHATSLGSQQCDACEQVFARRARAVRKGALLLWLFSALVGLAVVVTGDGAHVLVAQLSVVAMVIAAGLPAFFGLGALVTAALRAMFRRQAKYQWWIDESPLEIAPRSLDDHERIVVRLSTPASHRPRGETPAVPIYQRTYGVG